MTKIHILFKIYDKPTGGGNQFLRSLKNFLQTIDAYEENVEKADAVLFNSHQYVEIVSKLKQKYPYKLFVHRIDGPIRLYNNLDDKRDLIVNTFNKMISDATIFQSEWSKKQNHNMGLEQNNFETVIQNAPDPLIFNKEKKEPFSSKRRIRLIATSWSSNIKKGFHIYEWLDNNLDFEQYDMTFVGNSPISFKRINHINSLTSKNLSELLKKNDIFITASQKDPCSNSLIEAMHCGLPALALKDGGHIKLVGTGGELFEKVSEIPYCLEKIVKYYSEYQRNISLPGMDTIGRLYYTFIESLLLEIHNKRYQPKELSRKNYYKLKYLLIKIKLIEILKIKLSI